MSLKSDCLDANKGNAAAIKRLRSFILSCKLSKNNEGIEALIKLKCPLVGDIKDAQDCLKKAILPELENRSKINKFSLYLSQVEALLVKTDNKNAIAILKEMSKLRWQIKPNQDFYNKDARFMEIVSLLKKNGAGISL